MRIDEMAVDQILLPWNRLLQGWRRFFVSFITLGCLLAYFGPTAWRWSFPLSQVLPQCYACGLFLDEDVRYYPAAKLKLKVQGEVPFLSELPYTRSQRSETSGHLLPMVTPRIIIQEEEEKPLGLTLP